VAIGEISHITTLYRMFPEAVTRQISTIERFIRLEHVVNCEEIGYWLVNQCNTDWTSRLLPIRVQSLVGADTRYESPVCSNQRDITMTRNNNIVLSDEEKELLMETKRTLYGEDSIPHGHVIGTALQRVLNDARQEGLASN